MNAAVYFERCGHGRAEAALDANFLSELLSRRGRADGSAKYMPAFASDAATVSFRLTRTEPSIRHSARFAKKPDL